MQHFKKNWTVAEQIQAISIAEKFYQERYEKYGADGPMAQSRKAKQPRIKTLIRDLSSDDETEDDSSSLEQSSRAPSTTPLLHSFTSDSQSELRGPWYESFRRYLDTTENVPDGMSTVEWWGVRTPFCCAHTLTNQALKVERT
jgi:hypothetical protein